MNHSKCIPLPREYLQVCSSVRQPEFTHVQYTPVQDSPEDFGTLRQPGYEMRQNTLNRHTELFIVITMYNESEVFLARTLHASIENIRQLCLPKAKRSWGPNGWMNAVICIIADGASKINPRALKLLNVMGIYPDGFEFKSVHDEKPVIGHLFEFTTQVSVDENMRRYTHEDGIIPTQVCFFLKEKNSKKINSHRWFFNAFGKKLNPNVCILLDVGTAPQQKAFFHLWRGTL
jgi:chitin synthase